MFASKLHNLILKGAYLHSDVHFHLILQVCFDADIHIPVLEQNVKSRVFSCNTVFFFPCAVTAFT